MPQDLLHIAITALETQRETLGDAVVDTAVAALYEKIAALQRGEKTAERQRKQVSILFADFSGFTTLSERLDAEDVSDLVNSLWRCVDQEIMAHGGMIDKHIGDAVMALWGADAAREDDPERAIRAALAIQETLAQGAFPGASQMGARLQLRIAVHTGPVLLGETGVTGEYTAIGDTVNTASRLQHHAPLGGIAISQATYQQVRGLFETQPLEPIQVKGKSEPLVAYRVVRARPRAFRTRTRGLDGVSTRMIGREAELDHLQQTLEQTIQASLARLVTIDGEAGVGKSRLLYEFENWVRTRQNPVNVFYGRAALDTQNRPYALLRDLFANHLKIQENDSLPRVWQKIERGIGDEMQAHFIGQMLGFDFAASPHLKDVLGDARQVRNRALAYLTQFFRAAANLDPVALFLEDIHWADDSSLDAVQSLFRALNHQPVLFVCLARPMLFERRSQWGMYAGGSRLKLAPLSRASSLHLVGEILPRFGQIPATLEALILNNAEGNPYYIEELMRMLFDEGVITRQAEDWQINFERLQDVRLPATLTGILQARLDSLPEEERKTLQRSAVVGRTFWDRAVESLTAGQPLSLEEALGGLQNRELVLPQADSAFAGAREFTFNHAILHDVTYESVLKRDRRQFHARIARWLIEQGGARVGEYSGLIASHLEKAGQTVEAVHYLRQAAESARQTFANAEATAYLTRALALVEEQDGSLRFDLLLAREGLYDLQGERATQEQDLAALEALSQSLSTSHQAQAALRRANFAQVTGDFPAAGAAARRAITLAGVGQEPHIQAAALVALGQSLWRMRNYGEASAILEQALSLSRTIQEQQVSADALRTLGNIAYDDRQYAAAEQYFNQSLQLCQQIGNRNGQSSVLNSLGILYRAMGDQPRGRAAYLQALHIAQETGDRRMESALLLNLGVWHRNQGDYPQAIQYYQKALLIHREIEDPLYESATHINLAVILQNLGDLEESREHYHQALEIKRRIGDRRGEGVALTGLASLSLRLGLFAQAGQDLQQALQIRRQLGDARGEAIVLENLAALARRNGDCALGCEYALQSLALARQADASVIAGYGYYELGLGRAALEQHPLAVEAFRQAISLWLQAQENSLAAEGRAQLGLSLLALGQMQDALQEVEIVLQFIAGTSTAESSRAGLMGSSDPAVIFFACYWVLAMVGDPRSPEMLTAAKQTLQEQASRISDPALRRTYLENIPEHKAIASL